MEPTFGCGETTEEADANHDLNLWNLMLRCRQVNLKLNPKKFQFKVPQVTWMGHLLSSKGITAHPERIKAIVEMPPPKDVKGVQRFLGMCNYLSRYTPNLADVVKPLIRLTHADAVWSWASQHEAAFHMAKQLIAGATTLKIFMSTSPACCKWMRVTQVWEEHCSKMASQLLSPVLPCQPLKQIMPQSRRSAWQSKLHAQSSTSICMGNRML